MLVVVCCFWFRCSLVVVVCLFFFCLRSLVVVSCSLLWACCGEACVARLFFNVCGPLFDVYVCLPFVVDCGLFVGVCLC